MNEIQDTLSSVSCLHQRYISFNDKYMYMYMYSVPASQDAHVYAQRERVQVPWLSLHTLLLAAVV